MKKINLSKLENIINYRLKGSSIGFNSTLKKFNERNIGDSLKELDNQDLLKFGMIPEFIGRLPVIATLDELDVKMLVKIMIEPKNALVKQFNSLLVIHFLFMAYLMGFNPYLKKHE